MYLSWLKRQLREPSFKEAQDLLDTIDRVYEDAEECETALLQGGQNTDPYAATSRFVKNNVKMLLHVLIDIPSVDVQGMLDVMIASKGYERISHELEVWKKRPDEIVTQDEEFLKDLGDHPF